MVVKILSSEHRSLPRIIKQAELESRRYRIGEPDGGSAEPDERLETARLRAEAELAGRQLLLEAEKQAELVMSEARSEAVRLLEEAQQKVARLEAQAREEGLQRGEAEGRARLQAGLDQLQQLLSAAQADRARLLAGSEAEVVHLVLQIVRKILKIEPLINEQALIRVVRDALAHLGQRVDVNIYVHPEDVELLHFSLTQISELALEIVIEPDERIEPGGCRIESRSGEIDARISTQFDAIARSFLALAEGKENQIE